MVDGRKFSNQTYYKLFGGGNFHASMGVSQNQLRLLS